jgi:PIN domain nuclease of toxin-antitoxin system
VGRDDVNLLLDTHIWLWALLEPDRLAPRVSAALTADNVRRWLSPLSIWEALLLIERGRLSVDQPPTEWVREALRRAPVEEAPLTVEVAIASRALTMSCQDPVDRFLAATAQVYELTLVTADAHLLALKGISLLANTVSRRPRRPRTKR